MDGVKTRHERRIKKWCYHPEGLSLIILALPIMAVEIMINLIRFYRPVVLILVCACAYWYTPNLRMIIDDEAVMSEFKVTDTINAETKEILKREIEPLTFRAEALQVFRGEIWILHILGLLLHILLVISFYLVFSRRFGRDTAFMGMALYAVHPANVQVVSWISGTNYTWCALLLAVPLLASRAAWIFSYGAILKAITMFIYPVFMFPFIWKNKIYRILCGIISFIGIFKLWKYLYGALRENRIIFAGNIFQVFIGVVKTYAYNLKQAIFPLRLGFYHEAGYRTSEALGQCDFFFFLSLLVMTVFGMSIYLLRKNKAYYWGMMWFLIFLIPASNVIQVHMLFSDRYLYISLLGFCLAVGSLFAEKNTNCRKNK